MSRYLIVGASGSVGRHVLAQLVGRGADVRALVRNPDAPGPPGVDVVWGDLTLPETLDGCLRGVDGVFLPWTAPPATVADCVKRIANQARRIVFLSAPLKTEHPLWQKPQPNANSMLLAQIERLIETSGLQWTFLRPGMFASNALSWWAPQIRVGRIVRWPYLSVPTAPIDDRDIAAVAVRALCEPGHDGAEYVLTGPQSLTQFEQLSVISRAIGLSLCVEEMSPTMLAGSGSPRGRRL